MFATLPTGEWEVLRHSIRLRFLKYDYFLEILHDRKMKAYTAITFEYWWTHTQIEDDHKEWVVNRLKQSNLIQE